MEKMNKEQVLSTDLWAIYWNFLKSLQEVYKQELQQKLLNETDLNSWIKSMRFFDRKGQAGCDNPELEEVYFQITNHKSKIRICIDYAHTKDANLELVRDRKPCYFHLKGEHNTKLIFLPEVILAAVLWLKDGRLDEQGIKYFESYGD